MHNDDDIYDELPTEADTPAIDPETGGWADNPFAAASGNAQPGAPPPADDAVANLKLPGTEASPEAPAPAPAPARQSQPLPMPSARTSQPLPLPDPRQSQPLPAPPHGGQAWGPQVPLPDPTDFQRGQQVTGGKLPPPPGYGAKPEGERQGSSISYTMDIILSALEPGRKKRKWVVLGVLLVLIGAGVAVWYFGFSGVGDRIEEDGGDEPEMEIGAPEWVALPTVRTEIRSTPSGAAVILNGLATGETTPVALDLIADARNTVMLFDTGHAPAVEVIAEGADHSAGLDVALSPIGEAPTGWIKVTVLEEDAGAEVFVDGRLSGTAPVLVEDLLLGSYHHIEVRKEGKAPYVRVFRLEDPKAEFQVPLLSSGTYLDRDAEVLLNYAPSQAKLIVDGEAKPPGREVHAKGELIQLELAMAGRERFDFSLHTTGAGTFDVSAEIKVLSLGKAKVRWRTRDDDMHPCLVRPGAGFCWRGDADEWREVAEGDWTLQVYEEDKDGRKNYLQSEIPISFQANKQYKVKLDVDRDTREVSVDDGSPRDWDPDEDD